EQATAELKKNYEDTAYAARGALLAADFYLRGGNIDKAAQELNWLAGRGSDFPELLPVAKLRLASVYADQKKFDEALEQLNNPPEAFKALYDDRKGDVLIAQGKKPEAVAAWRSALSGQRLPAAFVNTIQLKISALGGE
ncbi:MAG: YfgM family protein, partial [Advenella sp.]